MPQKVPFIKRIDRRVWAVLILASGACAHWMNDHIQFLCQPVPWAKTVFMLFFSALVLHPFLEGKSKLLDHVMIGLQAIGVWISIYLICFSGPVLFLSLILIGMLIGILPFLPFGWLVQIFYNVAKAVTKTTRITFFITLLLPVIPTSYYAINYGRTAVVIGQHGWEDEDLEKIASTIPRTYMGERITGLHFKYHTRFCEFDGWRPPLHDPLVVIGMEFNASADPLAHLELDQRVKVYRLAFPNHEAQVNCTCAKAYGDLYINDKIFEVD